MDEYKYVVYSNCVPEGMTCIKVGAKKTDENILRRVKTSLWPYPTFSYLVRPDDKFLSPYGNLFWMYECVLVKTPIYVDVYKYGNGKREIVSVLASIELSNDCDIWEICHKVETAWK